MEIHYKRDKDMEVLEEMDRIPCGYSLPNYYTYVVDDNMHPMPAGMPGQVRLGGAGVSLGYWKNPELTARQFVKNPFATEDDKRRGWDRLYLTGDIGHLQPDGAMVFHHRVAGDTQVKIRGLRIELSDIENNIVEASAGVLKQAVVALRENDLLIAHVVFKQDNPITDDEKHLFLRQLLSNLPVPQYMIPVAAIPLSSLPLTLHSRVDRKAVQAMPLLDNQKIDDREEEQGGTTTVHHLRGLWKDILGTIIVDRLGIAITPSTSFFEAGGNSLLAVRLQARIRHFFDVNIPLFDLLDNNTLAAMAQKIDEASCVQQIDWHKETKPASIMELSRLPTSETPNNSPQTFLITGASGFLGYILAIRTIHFLAVRDVNKLQSFDSSPKLVIHPSDLSHPTLGLDKSAMKDLATSVDVILHLGAARSFWDSYHVLRPVNVLATKTLIGLASPRHIPIRYISTGAVTDVDQESLDKLRKHMPGYTATRWVSEQVLSRTAADLDIASTVVRLWPATEPREASRELLQDLTERSRQIGCKPDLQGWTGRMDLLWAKDVAKMVADSEATVDLKSTFTVTESDLAGLEVDD
ncbi:hypothetical protein ACHAPJ_012075 [Fusarium lateritium]